MTTTDKVRENRLRRKAARLECHFNRSRAKQLHCNNHGLYQVISWDGHDCTGLNFDATLDAVEWFLNDREAKLRAA